MSWANPEWTLSAFIMIMIFWLGGMGITWLTMNSILKREVGIEKADEIQKSKSFVKRLLHLGYSQYIQKKKIAFFILQWQFYIAIFFLLIFPMECTRYYEPIDIMYLLGALGMVGVSGMTNWEWLEDDEEIDKSGEPEEIVSARVEWKNAWKKLQQTKRQWTEENSRLDRKQKLKLLDKLETDTSYAEYALIEYYAYYAVRTPENIEEREQRLQILYDTFGMIDSARKKLEAKADSCFYLSSQLFACDEPYRTDYEKAKQKFEQAEQEEKQTYLSAMLDEVDLFLDSIAERWGMNKGLSREIEGGLQANRDMALSMLDEIEAYQKQIQAPGLEENLKEIYHNMHLNGTLPPEREGHFPDAIHQGEIHRVYDYD